MKVLLLLVLLADLVVFSAVRGWLGEGVRAAVVPEQRETSRSAQQAAAGQVEILAPAPASIAAGAASAAAAPAGAPASDTAQPAAPASASTPASAPVSASAPASTTAVASAASTLAAAARATGPAACLELVGLTPDDARRTADQISADRLAGLVAVKPAPEAVTYMVYLPALASKAAADRVAGDLRSKGFDDFLVIQDNGEMRNAISLGVFRSGEAAASRIAALSTHGFKGARIATRASGVPRQRVEVREVREEARTRLDQLAREFSGIEWRDCPASAAAPAAGRGDATKGDPPRGDARKG